MLPCLLRQGGSFSVGRTAYYYKAFAKGQTAKLIQDAHMSQGEFICKTHSGIEYVLEKHPWVVCCKHKTPDGVEHSQILILDKDKREKYSLADGAYEGILGYCTAHPTKHVIFDGKDYVFPEQEQAAQ